MFIQKVQVNVVQGLEVNVVQGLEVWEYMVMSFKTDDEYALCCTF